ncbi:hypothetical protein SLEP1_g36921 [Rubroshorea leprosula]|uniref:Uncharacterized protein n=1 Tax=Rubroshorea leprosula TaxID=152421 RepID=A0AAV5KT37_9ROSI|nr:hypothetical protein SLEP1_g36921 [Rubroshorea leprosula]
MSSGGGTLDTLGGRLVSLVYPKRRAVVAVRKLERGRPSRPQVRVQPDRERAPQTQPPRTGSHSSIRSLNCLSFANSVVNSFFILEFLFLVQLFIENGQLKLIALVIVVAEVLGRGVYQFQVYRL